MCVFGFTYNKNCRGDIKRIYSGHDIPICIFVLYDWVLCQRLKDGDVLRQYADEPIPFIIMFYLCDLN